MLVITCIKQVPDTTQVKTDPVTGTLIREGVPFIVNPFDTPALEESLRLKDKYGFRVAVISMGPMASAKTLLVARVSMETRLRWDLALLPVWDTHS